jgi:hypothetical protein
LKDEVSGNFSLSKSGKLCKHPVSSIRECKKAAKSWTNAVYVRATGTGHDLPYGCIAHNTTSQHTVLYWNPGGVTVSQDPNVRQVCKEKVDLNEGTYILILELNT